MTTAITRYGTVSGELVDGVIRFLGIPYAASPTGAAPVPATRAAEPWDGVRECVRFSATPPKPAYAAPFDQILPEPSIPGDDWLTVNIWTPDLAGAAPVMVWIHGGDLRRSAARDRAGPARRLSGRAERQVGADRKTVPGTGDGPASRPTRRAPPGTSACELASGCDRVPAGEHRLQR